MLVLLGCNIGCNIYASMLFQKAHCHFIACSAFNMSPPLTTTLSLTLVPHVLVKLPNLFASFRWARLSSTGESFRGESERETDPPEPAKAAATGNDWHINSTVRRGQTARRERRGEGGGAGPASLASSPPPGNTAGRLGNFATDARASGVRCVS